MKRLIATLAVFATLVGGALVTAPAAQAQTVTYFLCSDRNGTLVTVGQVAPATTGTCGTDRAPPDGAYIVPVAWETGLCLQDGTRFARGQTVPPGLTSCAGGAGPAVMVGATGGHWVGTIWCPALGSPDFLAANPQPPGDGWVMVETVPGKPCGGWRRVAGGN